MSQARRSSIVLLVGGVCLYFVAQQLVESPAYLLPKDFPEYWSAGRLNLHGENPYDPQKLLAVQQQYEHDRDQPLMMWNPPPALALYMPLGLIPFKLASLFWVGVQLFSVMLACDLLWREYLPARDRWLGQLVGLAFVGTWWMVSFGQNTGFLLLGLAGFLHFWQRDRPVAAGACVAVTALKPHLLAAFGLLLLVEIISRKGRTLLLAGATVVALSLVIAVIANPNVVGQYFAATRAPGPGAIKLHEWVLPVASYWFRVKIDRERFWLQFLPCTLASIGLLIWRFASGSRWKWKTALPVVVAVSVLATPYGWIFDLPVLLVTVVWAACRLTRQRQWQLLGFFLGGQVAVTGISVAFVYDLHDFWWVAPGVVGLCGLGFYSIKQCSHDSDGD